MKKLKQKKNISNFVRFELDLKEDIRMDENSSEFGYLKRPI